MTARRKVILPWQRVAAKVIAEAPVVLTSGNDMDNPESDIGAAPWKRPRGVAIRAGGVAFGPIMTRPFAG